MTDFSIHESPRPSDEDRAVTGTGVGDTCTGVFSMSARMPNGDDAEYLRWHMLDHLPEQYRLIGCRGGQRWVSTPQCRAARAASVEFFDEVDHIVNYLFAEPVDPALDAFFDLGATLRAAGRMPGRWFRADDSGGTLRRSQLGLYEVAEKVASPNALVGGAVLPWRPARGVYVVIEDVSEGDGRPEDFAELAGIAGVAGYWRYRGSTKRRAGHSVDTSRHSLTVLYLDVEPSPTAPLIAEALERRWAGGALVPLLAAPFEIVVPWQWERALP